MAGPDRWVCIPSSQKPLMRKPTPTVVLFLLFEVVGYVRREMHEFTVNDVISGCIYVVVVDCIGWGS